MAAKNNILLPALVMATNYYVVLHLRSFNYYGEVIYFSSGLHCQM